MIVVEECLLLSLNPKPWSDKRNLRLHARMFLVFAAMLSVNLPSGHGGGLSYLGEQQATAASNSWFRNVGNCTCLLFCSLTRRLSKRVALAIGMVASGDRRYAGTKTHYSTTCEISLIPLCSPGHVFLCNGFGICLCHSQVLPIQYVSRQP